MTRHILMTLVLAVTAQAQTTPVFLVIVDDVGNDMLENAAGHTPSLDALASEGLWFENFWSAPKCSQFRARVMSGQYAFRAGSLVGSVVNANDGEVWTLPTPGVLPSAIVGESTLAGKWHLAQPSRTTHPLECGFDTAWYTLHNLGHSDATYYGGKCFDNGTPSSWVGYVTTETSTHAARALIREDRLVVASFHAPHKPFHEPPGWMHTYGDLTGATDSELVLAMLEACDTMIGRLSNLALAHGYTVIVCSDNGTAVELGGEKGKLTEVSVTTWMVVAGPGVRQGEVSPRLVDATDIYATVTHLANGAPTYTQDSLTFYDELHTAGAGTQRDFLFVDKFDPNGTIPTSAEHKRAIRDERWKASWPDGGPTSTPTEFYDLALDPGETTNLLVPGPLNAEQQAALDALLAVHP